MKKIFFIIIALCFSYALNAQMHGGGNLNPGELDTVTVSGTVIVDESFTHPMYYLDEDGDTEADYFLNFGPFWYEPDSSNAVRPSNGDNVTITGGLHERFNTTEQAIVVYEINGEFWRDPYFANWNNIGRHSHRMGRHHGGMQGYGFGWDHDSLETVELSGTALVDTTFYMNHYYLDSDGDETPDFFLNFGPPWYEPSSGALRPLDGESIEIVGGKIENGNEVPMVIVFEIGGLEWRDSSLIGPHFGGGWFNRNMTDAQTFHSPFDMHDRMTVNPGWRTGNGGGHHGGGMFPDSLFCQILEIFPENIPNHEGMNVIAGYEVHLYQPDGFSGMTRGGMMGGHMSLGSDVQFQMHYSDSQLDFYNADEGAVEAKYWDDQSSSWISVNASVDVQNNTVSFESSEVSNFVILTAANNVTAVNSDDSSIPKEFSLEQNYPNPFNPSTTIGFNLNDNVHVVLNIYNILGERTAQLINEQLSAGYHNVNFNAVNLPSGIYFYELTAGSVTKVRKMNLIK